MQAVELGTALKLGERAREVHVAEDPVRLGSLVRAAQKNGVRALADQLDALQVVPDRRHRQRQDAPAREDACRRHRSRLQLAVLELDPEPSDRRRERQARLGCVVRQQAEPVPRVAKAPHGISRSVDRPAGDVQDPVDV